MKRQLLLFILVVCGTLSYAQNDSTKIAIEQINRIKLDSEHYLYSEVTMSDWLEAYNAAKLLLKEQLSSWLVNNYNEPDVTSFVARSDEHIFEIKAQRGNRYRAFVYIKKSDILTFREERQLVTVTSEDIKDKVAEENLFRIPEQKELAKTTLESVTETTQVLSDLEMEMLAVRGFDAIEPFVTEHQEKGTISVFGKYASRPGSGQYYMFVYNRQAEIPAHLRYDDGVIVNLKTGKQDSMDAYKDCGAIWFK